MSSQTTENNDPTQPNGEFQTGQVATIGFGHFVHDLYGSAFLPALLPILKSKLEVTYAAAGLLVFFSQLPNVLNPFFGFMADKVSLRYGVIFAPAVTATIIGGVGLINNYTTLAILLLCAGLSISIYHAPAPPLVAQISGGEVGRGMSYFMFGGEIARALGPLSAIWAVSLFGLEGMWRLMFLAWGTSAFLYYRLKDVKPPPSAVNQTGLEKFWGPARQVFPTLALMTMLRVPLLVAITVYLPTYVNDARGSGLWLAAGALTVLEGAGAIGIVFSGTISDRLGRKPVLFVQLLMAPLMLLGFLYMPTWLTVLFLALLGLFAITPMPVLMAMVQDHFPDNRAFANGIFMAINFVFRGAGIYLVGWWADSFGLNNAFLWSGLLAFLSVPTVFMLPNVVKPEQTRNADSV